MLLGGPASPIPSDPKGALLNPFSPSIGAAADWGNEDMGQTTANGGNITSQADAFAVIYGNGANNYHVRTLTDAELSAQPPDAPTGYGGSASGTINLQLYSTINGLVTGQDYTLELHYDLDFISTAGQTDHDQSETEAVMQAFVGDNSNIALSQDFFLNNMLNLGDEMESGDSFDHIINFTATAPTMDFWLEVNQHSSVSSDGPSDISDDIGAGFNNDIYFSVVPEPASISSLAIGIGMLFLGYFRQKNRAPKMISPSPFGRGLG